MNGKSYKVVAFDEGSYSGTSVDGIPIRRGKGRRLLPGSYLKIGDRELWALEYNSSGLNRRPVSNVESNPLYASAGGQQKPAARTNNRCVWTRDYTVDRSCAAEDLQRCVSTQAVEEWMRENVYTRNWEYNQEDAARMGLRSFRIFDEQKDQENCVSQRIIVRKKDTDESLKRLQEGLLGLTVGCVIECEIEQVLH